jgi:4-hydroxy-tetrahydrodipicolinate reductase
VTPAGAGGIRTVIVGASGRMGAQLLQLIGEFPALRLHGAVGSEESATLPSLLKDANLVLDFSQPVAAAATLAACVGARVPLLIGTTGLPRELDAPLSAAADAIALMVAANTSLGVNLLLELVRQAAHELPAGYDIQIVETHHRNKRDAPSGTALALSAAAASGRRVNPAEIGVVSLRGGDVVGEHEVWFLGEGERVLLKHSATDRAVFARGALLAGQWLAARTPGRYAMRDAFISKDK